MTDIVYKPITQNDGYKRNGTFSGGKPKGLVVHSTAIPNFDAVALQKNFDRPARGASIHAAVDDKTIIQCMPWTQIAGHVGSGSKGSYNYSHIGVEMCEPAGMTYNDPHSVVLAYNPPAGYFAKAWRNMVDLFAYLCNKFGLDPLEDGVVVSHAEAHARGYGGNHGDTAHWWKWEGKTMDDFRAAVAAAMAGESIREEDEDMTLDQFKALYAEMIAEKKGDSPSSWVGDSCEKAKAAGVFTGDGQGNYNWQDPVTREALAKVLDRAGVI